MDRKAQAQHIIVFVIGLIVMAAVLYFGYKVIADLGAQRCQVKEVEFGTTLSSMIERNRDYGIQKTVQLEMPCEGVGACFIDRELIDARAIEKLDSTPGTQLRIDNPQGTSYTRDINTSYKSQSPANVFILYSDGSARALDRFDDVSAAITVGDGYNTLCLPANTGVLRFRTEGTGRYVKVKSP